MKKAVLMGIVSSFFFGFTFVLNRQMSLTGGSWIWSASLRFLFMFPILLAMTLIKGELFPVLRDIRRRPAPWFLWSFVGFFLFYTALSSASIFGPSWLIAGTWQLTVITGALLSPLFYTTVDTASGPRKVRNRIPPKPLLFGCVILAGVALMQLQQASEISLHNALLGSLLVLVASITYPLGNRKMMVHCGNSFNTVQRVFGMTLCSLPFWIPLSLYGWASVGLPDNGQIIQSLLVAVVSGVTATLLYFHATSLVRHNPHQLAVVESTISVEVVFVLFGGVLFIHDPFPAPMALAGMVLVVLGMALNSFFAKA